MPKSLKTAKDADQLRLVTLIMTAVAAILSTLQVFYPFATDQNGLGEAGMIPLTFCVVIGVLMALLQFARFDSQKVQWFLRVLAGVLSVCAFVFLLVFTLVNYANLAEVWLEDRKASMSALIDSEGYVLFYSCNYVLLLWQLLNTWMLPTWAVGVFKGNAVDRVFLTVFGGIGAVAAGINAYFTWTVSEMPAFLRHNLAYVLVPMVMLTVPVCAFCIGRVHQKTAVK